MKLSLLFLLVLVGCGAPDTFELGYGHTWNAPGTASNEHQIVGLDMGDSDTGWVALGWDIGPRAVQLVREPEPYQAPIMEPDPSVPVEPTDHVHIESPGATVEIMKAFDAMGWATKILLVILALWLGWIYRRTIGGWIGRGEKKAVE